MNDLEMAGAQIRWERRMLQAASVIAFWFPEETVCPITLYELGAWSMTQKPLIIGAHPNYPRRFDVVTQTVLVRPDLSVHYELADVVDSILCLEGLL